MDLDFVAQKKNLASIQPPWLHAWSTMHFYWVLHPLCECPRVTALQVAKIPRLGNNDSAKKFEKLLLLNPITIGHERNVGDLFVTVLWTGFVSSLFNWQGMVSKWRLLLERSCRKWRLVRKYPTMCCLLGCPGSQALEEVNLHYRMLLTALFLIGVCELDWFQAFLQKAVLFFNNILHLLSVPYVDWDRYHFKLCSHILFHSPPLGSHAIPLFRGGRCVKFQ